MTNTHTNIALIRAYIRTLEWGLAAKAALAILGGCLVAGLLQLRAPEHRAYHKARVRYAGARLGSKKPGVRFEAELPDGRSVWMSSMRYNPDLKPGAIVCVQELRDRIWDSTLYMLALPSKCVTDPAVR
ncbi:MAG: hypothetical protein QNJ16_14305 [Rhodobacter sp.]|nr:hypothetical protein [Rhodobacter sp.]